ncbi:MAG TPA: hypothetical protein VIT92_07845, partial [Burkholderiaceae bacterium]
YLNDVMNQMLTYGERVRFAIGGGGMRPNFQVINSSERSMAFDGNIRLIHPKEGDFAGAKVSATFTLEQIETLATGGKLAPTSRAGTTHVAKGPRTGTIAAQALDVLNAEKYAYFKEHRGSLPAEIGSHSDAITKLMQGGLSAADAFGEIVKRHYS